MVKDTTGPPEAARGKNSPDTDWSWIGEDSAGWVPPTIDTSRPSVARIYDYLIGGKDNFAIDRTAAEKLAVMVPGAAEAARANRAFMVQTVRLMAEAGIDQFLDLGTGIPTSPNVHETARSVHPGASAVYVDNDPIVLAHSRALLADDRHVVTVPQDLRDPAAVLGHAALKRALDLDRPVGLLLIAVVHFVGLGSAPAIVARYLDSLPAGSMVAISAITRDGIDPDIIADVERLYASSSAPIVYRTRAQIEELFGGLELLSPGLKDVYRSAHGRVLGGVAII